MRYVIGLAIFGCLTASVAAQDDVERRLGAIEKRLSSIEDAANRAFFEANRASSYVFVCFVCGVICALWAQNTERSAWLWFFLGFFFNGLTLLVLLARNSSDRAMARRAAAPEESGLKERTP